MTVRIAILQQIVDNVEEMPYDAEMPALPTVANVLRADLLWSIGSDVAAGTHLFYRYTGGPPTSSDAQTLAADIYTPASALHPFFDSTTDLTGVKVTDLSSASGGVGEHVQATAGTSSSGVFPAGACTLVNFLIPRRYRGGKPRIYLPFGGPGDSVSRQHWGASYLTAVSSGLSTFFAAVIGLTAGTTVISEHVNVSYYSGFTVVTNPVTHRSRNVPTVRTTPVVDVVASYGVATPIASQRRRNRN